MIIGIDPGADGGLAALSGSQAWTVPMPGTPQLMALWLAALKPDCAWVERVHAFPGQGVSSCFTFGQAYGTILGVLAALGVPTHLVEPRAWKRSVLGNPDPVPANLDAKAAKAWARKAGKAQAVAYCLRRWPALSLKASERCKVHHDGMADALCIAAYGQARVDSWLG
jgi:Holliday junction resolvasome RuvABC endonuclease subunit